MPPFDPEEFLKLAAELTSGNPTERHFRAAIGRAYYAVFLLARDRVGVRSSRNVHQKTIEEVKRRKGPHAQLASLRQLRVIADYEMTPTDVRYMDWQKNWGDAQKIAHHILPQVKRL